MATQLTVSFRDAVYASILATFPGADDSERLAAMKAFVKTDLKELVTIRQLSALAVSQDQARTALVNSLATDMAD